ncbi:hypothetical protein GCM10010347_66190 [Streptomyces cirratus]|uniref:HEAT repeat domain-containing protein n=1 Tax=Streptomyces cirratus TaxID=68187 RepID=A0ABQ3F5R6_9ACTN|nr:hypothetical protein [Streptomyces cirratus]GHB85950.1 hypothetical protein GCM10010347_66190 [Streptomyces cirratus]
MSLIRISAELIRRAVVDEGYAQDLRDAVAADQVALEGLVYAEIVEEDLDWLVPSEWQWFAHWRQSLRGPLDETVLRHLSLAAVTRFARFDLRGLVLRDDRTNELAPEAGSHETRHDLGLRWLAHEAKEFPDSIEVALDALQYATEASWFTLRVLTSIDDEHSEEVRAQLREFATQRQLGEEILHRWGM